MNELMPFLKSLWTVWFFAIFICAIAWTLWPSRREAMEARGRIPLEDGHARQSEEGR